MIKVILTFIMTIVVVMLTSWALEWEFIERSMIRTAVVSVVMVFESAIGLAIIREQLKSNES